MPVVYLPEKAESVSLAFTGIENDDFIFARFVEFFVARQEYTCAEEWKHRADAVKKDVGLFACRFGIDVFHNTAIDVFVKLAAICLGSKRFEHGIVLPGIVFCEEIVQLRVVKLAE